MENQFGRASYGRDYFIGYNPFTLTLLARAGKIKMTQEQLRQIKTKIEEDLKIINREILELRERMKPIAPDCSLGRLTREEMIQEQKVDAHSLREVEIRLNKLTYALRKVDQAGYGVCMECEEEIVFGRLIILPESTHCVACKSELGL